MGCEITTGELAERLGVNASTISQALKGPLGAAKVGRGRIDVDHPAVKHYEQTTRLRKQQYEAGHTPRGRKSPGSDMSMPERFAARVESQRETTITPDDATSAEKKIIADTKRIEHVIQKLGLEIGVKRGDLVSRRLVVQLIGLINGVHTKLLTDGAKTLSKRVSMKALAGDTPEDIEMFVREILGKFLSQGRDKIKRMMAENEEQADSIENLEKTKADLDDE